MVEAIKMCVLNKGIDSSPALLRNQVQRGRRRITHSFCNASFVDSEGNKEAKGEDESKVSTTEAEMLLQSLSMRSPVLDILVLRDAHPSRHGSQISEVFFSSSYFPIWEFRVSFESILGLFRHHYGPLHIGGFKERGSTCLSTNRWREHKVARKITLTLRHRHHW